MSLKEDIKKVQKKVDVIEEQSWAMDILKDYKKANVRLFIVWLITFISFVGLLCYTIYLLNDIGTIETTTTQEVSQENSDGTNNFVGNDDTFDCRDREDIEGVWLVK